MEGRQHHPARYVRGHHGRFQYLATTTTTTYHAVPGYLVGQVPRVLCVWRRRCLGAAGVPALPPSRSAAPPGLGPLKTSPLKVLGLLGTPSAMGCCRVDARFLLWPWGGGTPGDLPASCHFAIRDVTVVVEELRDPQGWGGVGGWWGGQYRYQLSSAEIG